MLVVVYNHVPMLRNEGFLLNGLHLYGMWLSNKLVITYTIVHIANNSWSKHLELKCIHYSCWWLKLFLHCNCCNLQFLYHQSWPISLPLQLEPQDWSHRTNSIVGKVQSEVGFWNLGVNMEGVLVHMNQHEEPHHLLTLSRLVKWALLCNDALIYQGVHYRKTHLSIWSTHSLLCIKETCFHNNKWIHWCALGLVNHKWDNKLHVCVDAITLKLLWLNKDTIFSHSVQC